MSNHFTVEPLRTAASVLEDKEASIQLWANGLLNDTLYLEDTFAAYCALSSYGPKNDYNGKRSLALELQRNIDSEVLFPARLLYSEFFLKA